MNQIQVLGSHNSYKKMMRADAFAELQAGNPEVAATLEYGHPSLTEQLELGLRKLELDVFYDPQGTLFPAAQPGNGPHSLFPVLHVQNLDDQSNCVNLLVCLDEIRAWSEANPDHLPLFLSINAKDDVIDRPGFLHPLPFAEDAWLALDAELRSALGPGASDSGAAGPGMSPEPRSLLITPAEVFADGGLRWPELDAARGRILVVLDESGEKLASYSSRWRERAMFANLPEDHPGAAILIVNDPINDYGRIQRLVLAGFIVRTRADADTREARSGETLRRTRAFASGAQLISTDYYLPAEHFGTGYVVAITGGARCNPLLTATGCTINKVPREEPVLVEPYLQIPQR
ncbi:MAG: Ca2+-dependent phosphoinositide-specific phospholipase C [Pseudomonadales bacterium]|nr:hypothetical protein [Pseudomonadales bacterium]